MSGDSAHVSVLRQEVLLAFASSQLGVFFDATVGGGGHAEALLKEHPEIERYLACDVDPSAHEIAMKRLHKWSEKVEWIQGNFANLERFLDERGIATIDGYLIDAGVSSMQLDRKERGFSFRFDGPLDMRMDPENALTAEILVNEYPERELERIFREYGEERLARRAASAIAHARKKKRIETTEQLVQIVKPVLHWGHLHPATRIFQALRIAVNDELGALDRGLVAAISRLAPRGRLVVITFHSLEDRIVKNRIKEMQWRPEKRGVPSSGCLEIVTKKPIVPTEREQKENPRSRSAKMRIAEKIC